MRLWHLIKLVAGGGMLVVLGAAALMLWPLVWPPDPDASVQLVNGRLIGEATGYVGRVDRDTGTVDVSASLLGWRPVAIVVNEATAILVQHRQGGFGDLWKDAPVRVSYEIVGDRRLAKSIEVVTGDTEQSRGVVSGAVTAPVTPPPAVPPPAARAADPAAVRPVMDATPPRPAAPSPAVKPSPAPVAAPAPRPEPPPAKPSSAAAVEPPPRVEPPAVKRSPAPVAEPPRRVEPPATKPAPVTEPPRRSETAPPAAPRPEPVAPSPARVTKSSGEGDPGDGAAAIDWLLGARGR